jgi:hypothetical protein
METSDFWSLVDKQSPGGCWIWTGVVRANGYGQFFHRRKTVKAHRHAFKLSNGRIPKGKSVCHSCDVRLCCNPAHLWVGTASDNAKDCYRKGRMNPLPVMAGEKHPLAKLTDFQREAMKADRGAGASYRALGIKYGVAARTAHEIVNGRDYSYRDNRAS